MLSVDMQQLITDYSAGMVATITDDGLATVSPKATFVIVDERTLACGNIRSPRTARHLRARPDCEICFLDVLARKAVRVTARGTVIARSVASPELVAKFETAWADYVERMSGFFVFEVTAAELILSPAYDIDHTEAELVAQNMAKLEKISRQARR